MKKRLVKLLALGILATALTSGCCWVEHCHHYCDYDHYGYYGHCHDYYY